LTGYATTLAGSGALTGYATTLAGSGAFVGCETLTGTFVDYDAFAGSGTFVGYGAFTGCSTFPDTYPLSFDLTSLNDFVLTLTIYDTLAYFYLTISAYTLSWK